MLVCAGLGALVMYFFSDLWSVPFWLGCLFILYLHRDPKRDIPSSPAAVVSPADGIVTGTCRVRDPYLQRDATLVEIEMRHLGVYSTRSPVEGKVLEPRSHGEGLENRPHGVWLKTDADDDLVVVMHRGPLHNAPRCFVGFGERVGQGQRCGYIQLGGKVEIYLPTNSRVQVETGSHVRAGSDVIATLLHR